MAESKRCRKCGTWATHAVKYEEATHLGHPLGITPEAIRYTCGNCGFSYTTPTDDAPASRSSNTPNGGITLSKDQ